MIHCLAWFFPFLGCVLFSAFAAEEPSIHESSLFSVITQKGGVAKGLAHNHFVHAPKYEAKLTLDRENLESTRLEITFSVADLEIDDAETATKWFPKIRDMALLEEPFSQQSEKNLNKIRKSMFAGDQLNLKKFKEIKATILEIRAKPGQIGKSSFTHELTANLTIVGQTLPVTFAANLTNEDQLFRLEALALLKFSDFGIEPYSALFGAISVLDPFHIYIYLEAN